MVLSISKVGFIGLGAMGLPMVRNVIKNLGEDKKVFIFDIVQSILEQLVKESPDRVFKCSSAKEVADNSDAIFTMLPEGQHVRSIFVDGPDPICDSDVSGKFLVDCSTIDLATCLEIRGHVNKHFPSALFIDAPVSGGVVGAENGTMVFFLGCDSEDPNISKVTQLLELMGKTFIPCGGPSKGLVAKLAHNYLSGVIGIGVAEAMDIGMKAGLDPRILASVFKAGTAQNTICDRSCPVPGVYSTSPASNGYINGFKTPLMRKDCFLALQIAESLGAKNVLGKIVLDTYDAVEQDPKCKNLDFRVVYRYLGGSEDWFKGT